MSQIVTNITILRENTLAIKNVSNDLALNVLNPTDGESTITANPNAQGAYDATLQGQNALSQTLDASAKQITDIGNGFFAADTQGAKGFEHTMN